MEQLTTRPLRLPAPLVTGDPREWSRDLAVVGAFTGALAPWFVLFDPGFALAGGVVGGGTGLLLGTGLSHGLDALRGRVPLLALMWLVPVVGAVWGGATGALAGLFAAAPFSDGSGVMLGGMLGSVAGLVQLGWLWFPYTFLSVVRRQRWPVVMLATLAAPVLGWVSVVLLMGSFALVLPVGAMFLATVLYLALGRGSAAARR